jgi:hypothetical protein
MQPGTIKRMRSKSVSVNVKPKPASIAADKWLPAENVSIDEEWSEDIKQLRTGEPVTRTLTIKAEGLTAEQLKDVEFKEINGIKQYPDKAVTENQQKRDGITGIRQIKVAMIPTHEGKFVIPEISIPWWNTRTGKQEYASLPETIIEASGMASTAGTPAPVEILPPQAKGVEQQSTEPARTETASDEGSIKPGYWPWISLALAIGWITTALLFFNSSRPRTAEHKPAPLPPILPLQHAVDKACSNGDAVKTKDALLEWAAVRWPEESITSLADIASVSPAELSNQINKLNRALYSPHADNWQPKALRSTFRTFISNKRKTTKTQDSVLEPLYKT